MTSKLPSIEDTSTERTDKISVHAQPLALSVSPTPSGMRVGIDSVITY